MRVLIESIYGRVVCGMVVGGTREDDGSWSLDAPFAVRCDETGARVRVMEPWNCSFDVLLDVAA